MLIVMSAMVRMGRPSEGDNTSQVRFDWFKLMRRILSGVGQNTPSSEGA
jgi:hypothetical protein